MNLTTALIADRILINVIRNIELKKFAHNFLIMSKMIREWLLKKKRERERERERESEFNILTHYNLN